MTALGTIVETWKQPTCSLIDEWEKKAVVHIHNRIVLGHKKEWNLTFCDSVNGPRGHYAEWNKSDRKIMIFLHLYVESKEQKN